MDLLTNMNLLTNIVMLTNFFREKKMNISIGNFEIELSELLNQYFSVDELNHLNLYINPPVERSDKITGMINNFYKNQLQININNYMHQ